MQLRETLGLFTTGVIIACARRRNFLAENFFAQRFLSGEFSEHSFLEKIKKIFATEFFGMTINSFTSVSLNPPLVSFCIYNKSTNLKLFKKNRYFSLNVLSQEQLDLAQAFATPRNSKKWGVEPYFLGQKGNPIFQNSLAFFECKKQRIIKCGDHHIIIGEILDFGKINHGKPLVFFGGNFNAS
ncbi:MAG: flavin reductase family protein [Alphaproteobacteria bacterium]|nr:flavin reductase family protein [Alphaproteobacteria bacterium]